MDKVQDVSCPNNNDVSVPDLHEDKKIPCQSQKIVELTENEIKKFEVQNMEDNLTIKMLKRQLLQSRSDYLFTKKKLEDAQKQGDMQSENKNQLLQDNKKQVENFNKLKEFQFESIIKNMNNNEKTFTFGKNKNDELTNKFFLIKEKENSSKILYKEISNKKAKLNNDIQVQVENRRSVNNNLVEVLIESKNKIEQHKAQLKELSVDKHLKNLVENNRDSILRLTSDLETRQKRIKQEVDNLIQEKNNKLQDIKNNTKRIEEIKELLSNLQSELISLEKNQSLYNETLEKIKIKKEEIVQELNKKREICALSKKSHDENVENLRNEQEKISIELQKEKSKFVINEETLHKEFNELHDKVNEKKRLLNTFENYQNEVIKLREIKMVKQKEISNIEKDFQEKLKKSKDELKKYDTTFTMTNKKKNEFNGILKDRQNYRDSLNEKLEDKALDLKETKERKSNIESKVSESTNIEPESTDENSENTQLKTTPRFASADKRSAYSFDLSDSDSEEDNFKITNLQPKKNENQLKNESAFNRTMPQQSPSFTKESKDKVFNRTISQQPPSSTKESKDKDVFKVPPTYATPMRRKSTQQSNKS